MNYDFKKMKLRDVTLHISRGITPYYDENGEKFLIKSVFVIKN